MENHQQTYWHAWRLLSPVTGHSKLHHLATREERGIQDRGSESTRLVNEDLSDQWKIPTPEGHSISEPFRPEELATALRRLKSGKSPRLDSIFQKFTLHAESALKSWFCDFLSSSMRHFKIPKVWRRALIVAIPKPEKPLGDPNSNHPISLLCVLFKISRNSSTLVLNHSSIHCSHRSRRVFSTGGRP